MTTYPLEFSIVIVGHDCNPTVLNPDFLDRTGIVKAGWGWVVSPPPITTPPFARVAYDSGVAITVEVNRFHVTDEKAAGRVEGSKAPEIARRYVEVLPHVRYTGVGINLRTLIDMAEPEAHLRQRFLRPGPWDSERLTPSGLGLSLIYPLEGGRLTLSLEAATVTFPLDDRMEQRRGILASANFHRDCPGYPALDLVLSHIERAREDADQFAGIVDLFFGEMPA